MKWIISYIIIAFVFTNCSYKSKKSFCTSFPLKSNKELAIELYNVGLLNTLKASYLTDSIHFRTYLCHFDDESEIMSVQVNGDKILVEKSSNGRNDDSLPPHNNQSKMYSLNGLKESHIFD